jgi:hypothetical protein
MSQAVAPAVRPADAARRDPAAPLPLGYFQRRLPVALILGSFFLLTLPLTVLYFSFAGSPDFQRLQLLYVAVFALTHFAITPVVYLQSSNLRHFNSSWRNRVLYFVIPVLILVGFDMYRSLQVAVLFPAFAVVFGAAVRLLDFQHFGRQNFGVLQLFKARSACPFPGWAKRAEKYFFFAAPFLLWATFLRDDHRLDVTHPAIIAVLSVMTALAATVLAGFAVAFARSPCPGRLVAPLAYFLLQTASMLFAAYDTALYGIALAMHYVEYHVLMVPRCFHARLDSGRRVDRLLAALRRNKVILYGLLLLAAFLITLCASLGMSAMVGMGATLVRRWEAGGTAYLLLIAVFDGIFVFHYFVEALIWRFIEPHYRQTLGPLYFAPRQS